ncbi:MAG: hypothetical protein WC839_00430 [Candidatus Paceibacterota bacterium]
MENKISEIFTMEVGQFRIKADDIIIVDILLLPNTYRLGKHLDFTKSTLGDDMSITAMVNDLKLRNIDIGNKINKLILSGFFKKSFSSSIREIFDKVAIIKGRATYCRYPSVLIRDGFPADCYLIPPQITFHVAYIISKIFTKEFLNIHNMDRIFIMSDPLEKLDQDDDDLIVVYDPSYNKVITTGSYNNPYSGDQNAGYLFFTV